MSAFVRPPDTFTGSETIPILSLTFETPATSSTDKIESLTCFPRRRTMAMTYLESVSNALAGDDQGLAKRAKEKVRQSSNKKFQC